MKTQLCLVAGGTGFLGTHLVARLLRENYRVRVLARKPGLSPGWAAAKGRLELIGGDAADARVARAAMKGVRFLFLFSNSMLPAESNRSPVADIEGNLAGNVRLLEEASRAGVEKVVFPSSGGTVYGVPKSNPIPETHATNPICSYGIVKLATEKYLQLMEKQNGLGYVVLRYGNPYGIGQDPFRKFGVVAAFLGCLAKGRPLSMWGEGKVVRDFIYVDAAIDGTFRAFRYQGRERVFNLGSNRGTSVNHLVELLEKVTGIKSDVRHFAARPVDVPRVVLDISRARRELGWRPAVPLEEGIGRTWEWVRTRAS